MASASPFPILEDPSQLPHKHPHESFSAARALEARLKSTVRGEVRFDDASRALYATDSSNYRQVPIGLVLPRDTADVIATVAACREFGAPILSRGGGTSVAGQCCNVAVVIDFSKYMGSILELDPIAQIARVQPGIILDALRNQAETHQLTFAPDPATHSRCTLGGMIGNNSCGVHGLFGGKTVDNIQSLDILLYDGTRMTVGPTSEPQLTAIIAEGGRRGEIYAGLRRLRDNYSDLVRQRFPDIPRRVSGYNLDQLLPENGFNVARALVGSEGTCVTILEATCELKPSPQHRRLVVLGFDDAFIAADHVPAVLAFKPIGLEGFDGVLVDFMLRKNLAVDDVKLLPPGRGFLLCEFGADTPEDADRMATDFIAASKHFPHVPSPALYSPHEAERVWHVRESALGASVFVPGEQSGWEGWEDSAVPPAQLGAYLRELFQLIDRYGYRSPMYGHFGQGCVHLRMTFDFGTADGIAKYRRFIDEAADIVLKYGGSFSGEHGDGQARAALLPKMFGRELMQAFAEFKALWDPLNRMNPGKLIDPIAVYDPIDNLRFGAGYKAAEVKTWFQYPGDQGSFSDATTRCVGVGACRKQDHGTMCPSYMATREERHSTRGRAHLLWELMQGNVLQHGWRNREVKRCTRSLPLLQGLQGRVPGQRRHGNLEGGVPRAPLPGPAASAASLRVRIYGSLGESGFGRALALQSSPAHARLRLHHQVCLGVAPQRTFPQFAAAQLPQRFNKRASPEPRTAQPVLLWPDTWNNYFYPQALTSAPRSSPPPESPYRFLRSISAAVARSTTSDSSIDARRYLLRILDELEPQIAAGTPHRDARTQLRQRLSRRTPQLLPK